MRMTNLIRTAPLAMALGIVIACEPRDEPIDTPPAQEVPPAMTPADPTLGTQTAQFQPGPAGPTNVTGTARFMDMGAQGAQVNLELTGLTEGEYEVRLLDQPCGIAGQPGRAEPQEPGIDLPGTGTGEQVGQTVRAMQDGRLTATFTLNRDQLRTDDARQRSLHIFREGLGDEPSQSIACANLTGVTQPGVGTTPGTTPPATPPPGAGAR